MYLGSEVNVQLCVELMVFMFDCVDYDEEFLKRLIFEYVFICKWLIFVLGYLEVL